MTENTNKKDFEGFEFRTDSKDIIAGEPENLSIYDDGSGLTGDISEVDNYFDDDMIQSDKELNKLLEEI